MGKYIFLRKEEKEKKKIHKSRREVEETPGPRSQVLFAAQYPVIVYALNELLGPHWLYLKDETTILSGTPPIWEKR
jgi:hypothetical protein